MCQYTIMSQEIVTLNNTQWRRHWIICEV